MATNLALLQVSFSPFSANWALDVGTPMPFRSRLTRLEPRPQRRGHPLHRKLSAVCPFQSPPLSSSLPLLGTEPVEELVDIAS